MINNITTMDTRPQMSVSKTMTSMSSMGMPPILGFKTPILKEKANIRVKKIRRGDNIIIPGEIEDDYVDIVEEDSLEDFYDSPPPTLQSGVNFFASPNIISPPPKRKVKFLKNCYIIDFIQSPNPRRGLGTNAVKALAEKAMFDNKAQGRIVTFSAPIIKDASPAMFFYKLGFRFTEPASNEYMEECLRKNMPDIPAQIGMMYLPKARLHKLLRYGDMF